jgi:hypothetical protein
VTPASCDAVPAQSVVRPAQRDSVPCLNAVALGRRNSTLDGSYATPGWSDVALAQTAVARRWRDATSVGNAAKLRRNSVALRQRDVTLPWTAVALTRNNVAKNPSAVALNRPSSLQSRVASRTGTVSISDRGVPESPEKHVDASLIAGALRLEPIEDVSVNP